MAVVVGPVVVFLRHVGKTEDKTADFVRFIAVVGGPVAVFVRQGDKTRKTGGRRWFFEAF